jgi:PE family
MSNLFEVPDAVAAAAGDLDNIGSTISQANTAAAFPTTGLVAAGADDVSLGVAQLFGAHAQDYQILSAQLEAFHQQFVQNITAGASAYANAEAAGAKALQSSWQPAQQSLLNATNGAGGLLRGDGGTGGLSNNPQLHW